MRPTLKIAVLLAAFTAGLSLVRAAHAADAPQTMLVIDGSGSMWGRFEADKRAKIDVVRELLKTKIETAGPQQIGLTSFGHRRRSDCSDVEVIAKPGTDPLPVQEPLAKLNPRGKGPLVAALRDAAAALTPSRPASMIVINDGADNCQQDACAAATEIASEVPGVAIHMISIGVEPGDVPRLTCVSNATGGTFYDVKDSAGLGAAIDAAAALAMLTPGGTAPAAPAAASPTSPPAPTEASLQASVALAEGGAPLSIPVHWRIFKSGGTDVLAESDGPTVSAKVDPGSYEVEADTGRIRVKKSVSIEAGRSAGIIVALNAARLRITTNGEKLTATASAPVVSIEPVTDGKTQSDGAIIVRTSIDTEIIAAGSYAVTVTEGTARQTKPVTLEAGADTTVAFVLATGRIELSAGLRDDGGAIDDVTFSISEDDPDSPDGRREVARSRSPTPAFALPAGTYYASARSGDGEVHQRIAVGAGDIVKRALILPLVPVKVSALIGGQPATAAQGIVYRVTSLDGDRREITRSVLPEMTLNLLPGRYRIAAHLDAHHLKIAEEVAIEAGKSVSVILKFDAGEISLKPGAGTITSTGDTYWEIIDATGKAVWRSMAADAKAYLAPGRYTVHLDIRDKRTEAAFEVRSGERKVVQVGQN